MEQKRNFFPTLNEALESEGLLPSWDISRPPIHQGETVSYTYEDGSKHGRHVSIYRDERGYYERPIHYSRG